MCQPKPGPRCASSALNDLNNAHENLSSLLASGNVSSDKYQEASRKFQRAQADYFATQEGQQELMSQQRAFTANGDLNSAEHLQQFKGIDHKRKVGVAHIDKFKKSIDASEQEATLQERMDTVPPEELDTRIQDLKQEIKIAGAVDKDLRSLYTEQLDQGNDNPGLAKIIAKQNLQTDRFKREVSHYEGLRQSNLVG